MDSTSGEAKAFLSGWVTLPQDQFEEENEEKLKEEMKEYIGEWGKNEEMFLPSFPTLGWESGYTHGFHGHCTNSLSEFKFAQCTS